MTILNEMEKYLTEDDEFNYFDFGFDVSLDDISISEDDMYKLSEDLSGDIEGSVGVLEDVRSVVGDGILNVTGQIKLPSNVSYDSYKKSPAELALNIYNDALKESLNTFITDVDVQYDDDTEKFE